MPQTVFYHNPVPSSGAPRKLKLATSFHPKMGKVGLPHPSPLPHVGHNGIMAMNNNTCPSHNSGPVSPATGVVQEYYCGTNSCPTEAHDSLVPELNQIQTGCKQCSSIYEANKDRTSLDLKMNEFYNRVVLPSTNYNLTTLVFPY